MSTPEMSTAAIRVFVRGDVQGVGFRAATVRRARELGAMGWVRNGEQGDVMVHAEGTQRALDELTGFLRTGPAAARISAVELETVSVEGHEQFAIRGVSAGAFTVVEHATSKPAFELALEVDGVMRTWTLAKAPVLDPAIKRLAVEVVDRGAARDVGAGREARTGPLATDGVTVWDQGSYEQGGRVAWPEALDRGHAVFVLHGERLHGGFALQRTRPGAKPQWLLIKRRDEYAQPDPKSAKG